jgi:selenophosphate synthase
MVYPDNTTRNYNDVRDQVIGWDALEFLWLCDPQTSGGLIFTASPDLSGIIATLFKEKDLPLNKIGKLIDKMEKQIELVGPELSV